MRTTLAISEIVDEWLSCLDVIAQTKRDYRRKLERWFRYLSLSGLDPRSPSRVNVLEYKAWLLERQYSIYTVNSLMCMLRLFYGWCEDKKYWTNIAAGVKSIKSFGEYAKLPLSMDQAYSLIDSMQPPKRGTDIRDKLMIGLMLFNGLRTCEVERINIEDFERLEDETVVRIQRKGRHNKSDIVVLHQDIVAWFADYLEYRNFKKDGALFVSHKRRQNNRLSRQAISHIVKQRMRAVGIDNSKLTPHSLRHTYGTMLIEQGIDIETARDMMGHTDSKTTRIYVGLAQKRKLLKSSPSKLIFDKLFARS